MFLSNVLDTFFLLFYATHLLLFPKLTSKNNQGGFFTYVKKNGEKKFKR